MNPGPRSIHVVAAVLRDRQGRVLLAQRGEGRHLAGMWEFPGGKVDPGETPERALARELEEELGIRAGVSRPLIAVEHSYPARRVLLDVRELLDWHGEPWGREGQPLRWVRPEAMSALPMPEADAPVVAVLRLPSTIAISPEPTDADAFLAGLEATVGSGVGLIQLRAKALDAAGLERLAARALSLCRRHGARLVLNGAPEVALDLGLDGVHLSAERLSTISVRPLPRELWVGASCHDRESLQRAARLGLDYATLSPVAATRSHPAARPLGWPRFAAMRQGIPLPVYALGGMRPADLETARRYGAQGVAGIGSFWSAPDAVAFG